VPELKASSRAFFAGAIFHSLRQDCRARGSPRPRAAAPVRPWRPDAAGRLTGRVGKDQPAL